MQFKIAIQNRIVNAHDDFGILRSTDLHLRLVIEVETNEAHTGPSRFGVQALLEAVGANVAIEDRDVGLWIQFFDLQARS